MSRLDRALEVLASLGKPAERPRHTVPPRQPPSNGSCGICSAYVIWASGPAGGRFPLDRSPEDGNLVLVDGVALEFGPLHEGKNRFVRHKCRRTS